MSVNWVTTTARKMDHNVITEWDPMSASALLDTKATDTVVLVTLYPSNLEL